MTTRFRDQQGRPLDHDAFIRAVAEAVLVDIMVINEIAGAAPDIAIAVEPEGVTVAGGGAVFLVPCERPLDPETGNRIKAATAALADDWFENRLDPDDVARLRFRHDADQKLAAFRKARSGRE